MAATTGPATGSRNEPFVEIAQDAAGWHWCLWSGNGRPLARNVDPYGTQKHAIQAARLLEGTIGSAKLIVKGQEDLE